MQSLPVPCGPLSTAVCAALRTPAPADPVPLRRAEAVLAGPDGRQGSGGRHGSDKHRGPDGDFLADRDAQLALALLYELHHAGVAGADEALEWDPALLRLRGALEARLVAAVDAASADLLARAPGCADPAVGVDVALRALVEADDSPSVSGYLLRRGTPATARDAVAQKAAYHLREADSTTWTIPRLAGRAKAALVEIQADEYGNGRPGELHQELYGDLMRALGLAPAYGAYTERTCTPMLAFVNTMSLFGLHRRWRGRSTGHLAAVEATSSAPCRRMSRAMERLGVPARARRFYDVHVLADAVHEQLAAVDLCGSLVAQDPRMRAEVLAGAAAYLVLEGAVSRALLAAWEAGRTLTWPGGPAVAAPPVANVPAPVHGGETGESVPGGAAVREGAAVRRAGQAAPRLRLAARPAPVHAEVGAVA